MIDSEPLFAATGGSPSSATNAMFQRQGDFWTLAFGGKMVLLRDAKGLQYLAHLLQRPGEKISVSQLVAEPEVGVEAAAAGNDERARSAVTKRIRDSLEKIDKNHPALGRHLKTTIKTGYECSYSPDPDRPVTWQL